MNMYWNLVFNIWFLVTSWAKVKDIKEAKIMFMITSRWTYIVMFEIKENFKSPQ